MDPNITYERVRSGIFTHLYSVSYRNISVGIDQIFDISQVESVFYDKLHGAENKVLIDVLLDKSDDEILHYILSKPYSIIERLHIIVEQNMPCEMFADSGTYANGDRFNFYISSGNISMKIGKTNVYIYVYIAAADKTFKYKIKYHEFISNTHRIPLSTLLFGANVKSARSKN